MSTMYSKQEKRQGWINLALVLVCVMLIGALVVLRSPAGNINNFGTSISKTLVRFEGSSLSIGEASFATDEQYWSANCSHGWDSDAICDDIVSRAQACEIGTNSTYCSDYTIYLQQFLSKK